MDTPQRDKSQSDGEVENFSSDISISSDDVYSDPEFSGSEDDMDTNSVDTDDIDVILEKSIDIDINSNNSSGPNSATRRTHPNDLRNSKLIGFEVIEERFKKSRLPHHIFVRLYQRQTEFHVKQMLLEMRENTLILELQVATFNTTEICFKPDEVIFEDEDEDEFCSPTTVLGRQLYRELSTFPDFMKIGKLIVDSSIGVADEVFTDCAFFKKWTVNSFDYIITKTIYTSDMLVRMIRTLRVDKLAIYLKQGEVYTQKKSKKMPQDDGHAHVLVKKYKKPVILLPYHLNIREDEKIEFVKKISEAAGSVAVKGKNIITSFEAVREIVGVLVRLGCQKKTTIKQSHLTHFTIKSWTTKGPCYDRCHDDHGIRHSDEQLIACLGTNPDEPYSGCTSPITKMPINLETTLFSKFLATCTTLKCSFQTNITPEMVIGYLEEWLHFKRDIEEIKFYITDSMSEWQLSRLPWCEKTNWWKMRRVEKHRRQALFFHTPTSSNIVHIKTHTKGR